MLRKTWNNTYIEGKYTSFVVNVHCVVDSVDIGVKLARDRVTLTGKGGGVAELGKRHVVGTGATNCVSKIFIPTKRKDLRLKPIYFGMDTDIFLGELQHPLRQRRIGLGFDQANRLGGILGNKSSHILNRS